MYAFLGGFHAQKTICFRGCALATGFFPRSPHLFSAFGLNFWPLGASSLFVTLISGYAYLRVSNSNHINLIETNATRKTRKGFSEK